MVQASGRHLLAVEESDGDKNSTNFVSHVENGTCIVYIELINVTGSSNGDDSEITISCENSTASNGTEPQV